MRINLTGRAGLKIRASDGLTESGFPEMLSTPFFYQALPGDKLVMPDGAHKDYKFNVATYSPDILERWIYTYDYAPEQNWTVYRNDLTGESYRQNEYVFNERVYFRVCLRRTDGGHFGACEDINGILEFRALPRPQNDIKPWVKTEAWRVARKIKLLREPGDLAFAVLTDSHYTVNGTWGDTAAGLAAVHGLAGLDGVIHLGDMTDGAVPADVTRRYVNDILNDMKGLGVPVWAALGNHDSNYFKQNPERFSLREQSGLYLNRSEPRYFVDFDKQGLRLIFLDSFDTEQETRYGYSLECADWLARALAGMPDGFMAAVFSHLPPDSRFQYWAKEIRGGEKLMGVLDGYAPKIIAFINGHNHADRIDNEKFPVISIANAKCEAFTEYKPEGFITPERKLDRACQECWDIMVVRPKEGRAGFIRFGSGRDKLISGGKAEWV